MNKPDQFQQMRIDFYEELIWEQRKYHRTIADMKQDFAEQLADMDHPKGRYPISDMGRAIRNYIDHYKSWWGKE